MISPATISQAEAEKLVRMPAPEDKPALTIHSGAPMVQLNSDMLLVEDAEFDPELHGAIGTMAGNKLAKDRIKRQHVALVFDRKLRLLKALVPVCENGARRPGSYRYLNNELCKKAYKFTPSLKQQAMANNNIETENGVRRFVFPSSLLMEVSTQPRAKPATSATAALGTTASRGAVARRSNETDHSRLYASFCDIEKQRCDASMMAAMSILEASRRGQEDKVPGVLCSSMHSLPAARSVLPPDYILGHGVSVKIVDGVAVPDGVALRNQQVDLFNALTLGTQQAYAGRYTLTLDPDLAVADPSSSSSPPATPTTSMGKPTTPAAVSSTPTAGGQKRKSTAAAVVDPPAKRVDGSSDAAQRSTSDDQITTVVRTALPVLHTGLMSRPVFEAVFGSEKQPTGSFDMDTAASTAHPAAVVSGMQLSAVVPNPERFAKVLDYVRNMTTIGAEKFLSKADYDVFSKLTVAQLLDTKVPANASRVLTQRVIPVLALQFMAGMLEGQLSTEVITQTKTIVSLFTAYKNDNADLQTSKTTLEAELATANQKKDELVAALEEAQRALKALEEEKEAIAAAAAAAAPAPEPAAPEVDATEAPAEKW